MYKANGTIHYSPSDLTLYMDSPFASWMERYYLEYPQDCPEQDPLDPLLGALQEKGYAHESGLIESLRDDGRLLQDIGDIVSEDKYAATISAMQQGIDVIVQGRLESSTLSGFADFIVKVPGESKLGSYHYEVWDAKLSHTVKPSFLIQLCCYADMLETIQGICPTEISVVLGNKDRRQFQTSDFIYYYKSLLANFLSSMDNFGPNTKPDPAKSKTWGRWSNYATQMLTDQDHLFQVANITKSQMKNLSSAGINSMQQLVESTVTSVSGLRNDTLDRLRSQASLQKQSINIKTPKFQVLPHLEGDRNGLALLPPASPLDLFFDIEGYPFEDGGLEYLWGCAYFGENGEISFKDFWAHDAEQEKQAFKQFIEWAYSLWQEDPTMHIYHYAHYEISACRKLMGRYGICEFEVDQLLRNEVFVDLYKIVKSGLLIGTPSYSLKAIESLYGRHHTGSVVAGDESIIVYDRWRELYESGADTQDWASSPILTSIRSYNIEDCESTLDLANWLRKQQEENAITYLGKTEIVSPPQEEITAITTLRDQLLQKSINHDTSVSGNDSLPATLAWSLDYHAREEKPTWWRYYDRMGMTPVELFDDLDCLAFCQRTSKPGFLPGPRSKQMAFEYKFDPNQVFRGGISQFCLLGEEDENGNPVKVRFVSAFSDIANGIVVVQAEPEPPETISLVAFDFLPSHPIPQAIFDVANQYNLTTVESQSKAITDFLNRVPPRINHHSNGSIAPGETPSDRLPQIIEAVRNLDNSYMTIQGPPGAGKSFTAVRIIANLLNDGHRIGISSTSHRVINHLLLETAKYCNRKSITATYVCTQNTQPELKENGIKISQNRFLAGQINASCVIGTPVWGFARDDMAEKLDYLFIDEAGQVPVANLIAMSRAAQNLVLIGDQMQLSQPSQGSHPMESGFSILDYLLRGAPTIAEDMGIFLGTTYRMHPKINQFISSHIYDGKLEANEGTSIRTIMIPEAAGSPIDKDAGIVFIPAPHEGNIQGSDEEIDIIAHLTSQLVGRQFVPDLSHLQQGKTRPLELRDILYVAPYNYQVNKLQSRLGPEARIGSVDRFQGQEAPVVILSMCASDPSESPRGLNFLLSKNRMNVAISRAQTLAIIVANPNISTTPVATVEQMKLVNLFNAIVSLGSVP